jgi:hypothetical protein
LCCPIMCLYVLVCRSAHVLFTLLCLFVHCGVQHILCFVFVLFFFVLRTLCCQFLWIVHFWFPIRYSLTFISHIAVSQIHPCIDFPVIIWGTYFWFHQKRTICFENNESLKIIKY